MAATPEPGTAGAKRPDRYEVVNGVRVEIPPVSAFSSEVANRIRDELTVYGLATRSGRARSGMLFRVPVPEDPTRSRLPNAAFITFGRWPANRVIPYRGDQMDVVPDLAVEVAEPTSFLTDVVGRTIDYLRAGVRVVWVVYPSHKWVHAHTATSGPIRVFQEGDDLTCGDVLPGFSVPMAGLFPTPDALPQLPADE